MSQKDNIVAGKKLRAEFEQTGDVAKALGSSYNFFIGNDLDEAINTLNLIKKQTKEIEDSIVFLNFIKRHSDAVTTFREYLNYKHFVAMILLACDLETNLAKIANLKTGKCGDAPNALKRGYAEAISKVKKDAIKLLEKNDVDTTFAEAFVVYTFLFPSELVEAIKCKKA